MNLKSKYTAGRPSEEVLPMSSSQWNTEVLEEEPAFRLAGEPSAFSFDFGYIAAPFFNQHEDWDDDDEEEEDIDLDDDDDDDEIWEEEDFDVDEEDFEVEEEDDVDFDSFDDDEEEDVFEDEPEDRGHWVEDPNLLPCSPGYAIEARAESHQGKMK